MWIGALVFVLLLAVLIAGFLWPREVTIKALDPKLRIYEARLWHCDPRSPARRVVVVDYPALRWLDGQWRYRLRQAGIKVPPEHGCPILIWNPPTPTNLQNALLLFGYYPESVGMGFDLITTNGERINLGAYGAGYGGSPTNFGAFLFIETNLHGLFWLRFYGRPSVVAEVRIR